jgi:peptide/nickel transport system substrate-binding protein
MTTRAKWFGAALGAATVLSFAAGGTAATVHAQRAQSHAKASHSKAAATGTACKKRNAAKGTIKFSDWEFPDTLNPYQTTEAVSAEVTNGMFDGLVLFDQNGHLKADMLAKLPSIKNGGVKAGGKQIVLTLKQGMKWSNGKEITSADIKFGWDVGMNKATGPSCSGSCDVISKITTQGKYQATLFLKHLYAPVLSYGLPPIWPHVWPGAWASGDSNAAANKLAQDQTYTFEGSGYPTSGPYTPTSFVKDDRIVLTPMKYYNIQSCGGYVKQLIFAFFANKPAMIAAAANHDTDMTQDYTVADLAALQANKGAYKLYDGPGFIFEHVEYNLDPTYNGSPNPLANVKVRQALNLAIDKVGMIQSATGVSRAVAQNTVAWTPLVNTKQLVQPFADKAIKGQWDPILKKYVVPGTAKSVADAKKLLSQTPYASGFTIDFDTTSANPTRQNQLNVIANNWAKIGVKVNPTYVPATTFFAGWADQGTMDHGMYQAGMFAFLGEPDPDQLHYNLVSKYVDRDAATKASVNENYSGIKNPQIDKDFKTEAQSLNKAVRQKAFNDIQTILAQQGYWDPLYFRPSIATADSHIKGFANNPTQLGPTWNLYAWKTS